MGLFDRDYMRTPGGGSKSPHFFRPRDDGRNMLWTLIGINVAMFFVQSIFPEIGMYFVLSGRGLEHGMIFQLITSMFSHADFWHLLVNMWGLYLFGALVAPHFGNWRFLWLYLVSGLAGNLLHLCFNWSGAGLLGASGAVFGITIACAMLEPNRKFVLMFLPFFPVKTTTLVIVYTVIELFSLRTGAQSGVAHLAHLGGFVGGYLITLLLVSNQVVWRILPIGKRKAPPLANQKPQWTQPDYRHPEGAAGKGPVTQAELDYLLDKISLHTINSLTEAELERLRQAREQMRGQ